MSATGPQTVDDYNAAMREKIVALGATPVVVLDEKIKEPELKPVAIGGKPVKE